MREFTPTFDLNYAVTSFHKPLNKANSRWSHAGVPISSNLQFLQGRDIWKSFVENVDDKCSLISMCGLTWFHSSTANRYLLRAMSRVGAGASEFFESKAKSKWERKVKNIRLLLGVILWFL